MRKYLLAEISLQNTNWTGALSLTNDVYPSASIVREQNAYPDHKTSQDVHTNADIHGCEKIHGFEEKQFYGRGQSNRRSHDQQPQDACNKQWPTRITSR